MFTKLFAILSCPEGVLTTFLSIVLSLIVGSANIVLLIVLFAFVDLCWGVAVSIKRHKYCTSELLRDTAAKMLVYGTAIILFILLEFFIPGESMLTTKIVAGIICGIELWSVFGSMLIIFPHMVVLRLLRKALTGEIAKKLDCTPEEVELILNNKK